MAYIRLISRTAACFALVDNASVFGGGSAIGATEVIVVIFEVTPKDGKADTYFDIAGELRPELEKIDGFISIERFESHPTPGKFLSLSFWRDEDAVRTWRNHKDHALAQARGKQEIFADYKISVAEVIRDYSMADRI